MDLSLDDIIKIKKIGVAPSKKFSQKKILPVRKPHNKPEFEEVRRITDARLKIIQKNRAKIRDARDKLAEITRASGDARKKLIQKQLSSGGGDEVVLIKNSKPDYRSGRLLTRKVLNSRGVSGGSGLSLKTKGAQYRAATGRRSNGSSNSSSRLPDLFNVPRGYVDYDNMERMEQEEFDVASRLSRTIKNNKIPQYEGYSPKRNDVPPAAPRRLNSWGSSSEHFDPFDVYEVSREHRISPDLPLPPPKGILRPSVRQHSPTELYQRRYIPDPSSHLSYEMRSRLERAPDPHASMGIFSNPLKSSSSSLSLMTGNHSSSLGYRIVVSNLHTSVTQSDIRELFEDIGELYDSRIVRPGIAEVIYKSLLDAETAVETYHNRQLDGQPMKCLLVNPRASNKPTAPAIKNSSSTSRLNSGKTPLEIDIDALHKVLFRRH